MVSTFHSAQSENFLSDSSSIPCFDDKSFLSDIISINDFIEDDASIGESSNTSGFLECDVSWLLDDQLSLDSHEDDHSCNSLSYPSHKVDYSFFVDGSQDISIPQEFQNPSQIFHDKSESSEHENTSTSENPYMSIWNDPEESDSYDNAEEKIQRLIGKALSPDRERNQVRNVKTFDVLLGKGKKSNNNAGNVHFRCLVSTMVSDYKKSSKNQKTAIAREVVEITQKNGGRFLQPSSKSLDKWVEVTALVARRKASQALRDSP